MSGDLNIMSQINRLIRLSSPNLNYLIIAGMLMVYCAGIAYAIPRINAQATLSLCFVSTLILKFSGKHQ